RPERAAVTRGTRIIAAAMIVAGLVGLGALAHRYSASGGDPIPEWTLHVKGRASVPVTLPGNLYDQLKFDDVHYTLEAHLPLSDKRGQSLAMLLDCFHAPLELTVDGTRIADTGENGVGAHRYAIPASMTDRAAVHLVLAAHHDLQSAAGYGVAP